MTAAAIYYPFRVPFFSLKKNLQQQRIGVCMPPRLKAVCLTNKTWLIDGFQQNAQTDKLPGAREYIADERQTWDGQLKHLFSQ